MIQYKSQHEGRSELFERRSLMERNSSFCEIKFHNSLKINNMCKPSQYSHICKRLTVWWISCDSQRGCCQENSYFLRKEITVIYVIFLTCKWKFFLRKILSERNYYKLEEIISRNFWVQKERSIHHRLGLKPNHAVKWLVFLSPLCKIWAIVWQFMTKFVFLQHTFRYIESRHE